MASQVQRELISKVLQLLNHFQILFTGIGLGTVVFNEEQMKASLVASLVIYRNLGQMLAAIIHSYGHDMKKLDELAVQMIQNAQQQVLADAQKAANNGAPVAQESVILKPNGGPIL